MVASPPAMKIVSSSIMHASLAIPLILSTGNMNPSTVSTWEPEIIPWKKGDSF